MSTFEIKNEGARPQGFRVRGGVETVRPGQSRILELSTKPTKAEVAAYKERGVRIAPSDQEAENKTVSLGGSIADRVAANAIQPAEDPAETGGVVPQSSVSSEGGVDRKAGDTTTTTKPTNKQTGPVA